jgi:hypothetical protein
MIFLSLPEIPAIGYRSIFFTPAIPATMKIKNDIEVIFEHHFEKSYTGVIDVDQKENFLTHPILRIGGDCMAFEHVLIDLNAEDIYKMPIINMKYFKSDIGWLDMIVDGAFKEHEREPDPDWLK